MIGRSTARPDAPQNNPRSRKRRNGLNENYARELMELQTLGVNGGYTQKDVTEVARVFTGWTLADPREGGGYVFRPRVHEPGKKVVLGHTIKEGWEREGMQVLRNLLAHQPATARFISTELAQRFVSDDPPASLVDAMSKTFLSTDGDLREVLRTMFYSREFWAPQAYRARVKTPLEFVASALRATGADIADPQPLLATLKKMGMQLYGMQPPTLVALFHEGGCVGKLSRVARPHEFRLGTGSESHSRCKLRSYETAPCHLGQHRRSRHQSGTRLNIWRQGPAIGRHIQINA